MLDDLQRLRETPRLVELLAHYAALAEQDRTIWQKRLSSMDGVDAKELSRLHGELLAFEWLEVNSSRTSPAAGGVSPGIYRITSQGIRDLGQVQGVERLDEPEPPREPKRSFKRKRKAVEASGAVEGSSPASTTMPSLASCVALPQ
jgi:hypothetical protein